MQILALGLEFICFAPTTLSISNKTWDFAMSNKQTTENFEFQAEVAQILQLMIHSLYSNKEIFLRELISNASDACDKLRFAALKDDSLYAGDSDLKVIVSADKEAKTLTISDNGIGMSRDDIIDNIGTIARSGTKAFLESLTGDQKQDSHLIGQFGVGFYSSFIVADKVSVISQKAGTSEAHLWQSDGSGSYTIEAASRAGRGTDVILHLGDDELEFTDDWRLRAIIKKYSDNIELPVQMLEAEVPADKDDKEAAKKERQLETVNSAKALWTRPKAELKDADYTEFYKTIAHDWQDPLCWTHNKVEGSSEYTTLLYLPSQAPFDLYERDMQHGIKLYVQRVFIMDENKELMPHYLRFIKGLVDSADLPLNVSRELLQKNKIIDNIKNAAVKRILAMLENLAKNDAENYAKFWDTFGQVFKEGAVEDKDNQQRILKLCRFASTHADVPLQNCALDDYIARMQPDQEQIYYITADSFNAAKNSPHLESFRQQKTEVLLMSDRVDEWMMSQLSEYEGKKFVNAAKGELDIKAQEDDAATVEQAASLLERIKEVLADKVSDVKLSKRLVESPSCVVFGEHEMALHMQQLMKQAGHAIADSKPVLELNFKHPLIERIDREQDEDKFKDWSNLLYEQAILGAGGQLDDPASFVKNLNNLILQ